MTALLYPGQNEFTFDIEATDTCQDENVIFITSALWSPQDYGILILMNWACRLINSF